MFGSFFYINGKSFEARWPQLRLLRLVSRKWARAEIENSFNNKENVTIKRQISK